MSSIDKSKSSKYNCAICNDIFTRNSSLKRHIAVKHTDNDENKKTANSHYKTDDGYTSTINGNTNEQNSNNNNCHLCNKNFTRKWSLKKHMETCKGIKNKLQCEYCEKDFTHEKSRFRHYKTCITKKEFEIAKAEEAAAAKNNNTTQMNNNLTNGIQNNIQNNNIIIVYNPVGSTPFSTDHLKAEDFKKILKLASERLDNRILEEYSTHLFGNKENRCIRKTNIKSGHSKVHMGGNKWQSKLDKNIYPQLAYDMANNLAEYVEEKRESLKKEVYTRLREFVDAMCDAGYFNPEPTIREKEIQKEYKTFIEGLKLIVYENTKEST